MIVKSPPKLYTAAQFERLGNTDGKELINGRLVRKSMGAQSSWIQSELGYALKQHARKHKLGYVFESECPYSCFPHKFEQVRKPDISFIRTGRLPNGEIPEGNCPIVPDLVIEVLSPHEKTRLLNSKIEDFESVGVPMIWIVDSVRRRVQVRRADGSIRELKNDDILTGEDVLPGFEIPVRDLFAPAPV